MRIWLLILVVSMGWSLSALAGWDGLQYNKKVAAIQMDDGYVYVRLEGVSNICTGGNAWGVLKHNTDAHKSMLSALLAAQMAGKDVDVHSNVCTSPSGYCCIGNIQIK
jgi:hypothetical protein